VGESVVTRIRCGWGKFRELLPVLTSKRFSLCRKGRLFGACVRTVILHGCETWAVKEEDMMRLERADRAMIRWICGISFKDRIPSSELRNRLGLRSIDDLMRDKRLRGTGTLRGVMVHGLTNVESCQRWRVGVRWADPLRAGTRS